MNKTLEQAQLEFIQNGIGSGPVSQKLIASGMNMNVLKPWVGTNGKSYISMMVNGKPTAIQISNVATLRKDEWIQLDTAVLFAAQQRLVGVKDLYARNLVLRLGNGLATTVLQYEDLNEFTAAEMTMDAITRTKKDRPEFDLKSLPLPFVHKDFSINMRTLAASRAAAGAGGSALDTTAAMQSSRVVSEMVENMLFNGASSYSFGGGTIYGYIDHPQNNDVTLTVNWDDAAKTGELILDDVRSMKQASIDAMHYGPWVLYVPTAYETVLDDDFKANSDKTIRQRILEIQGIQAVTVIDKLPANTVLLVQMDIDTVRMVEGMAMTTVEWQEGGGFATNYKVMTIMVPQIRADQNGNCGVTVLS